MDREVAPELLQNERNKKWVIGFIIILVLIAGIYLFRRYLGSSVEASRIRTGIVQIGDVENTLSSQEEANQLFNPFYSSKHNGQGIGLTLSREILTNHGLHFSLKTNEDGWTEFVVLFNV